MRKLFLILIFFASLTSSLFAQEVKSLSTIAELDAIKDSAKGKVVLVNFWATWCAPCKKEFPDLIKLYSNYKDKGFVLVFISLDMPEDKDTQLIPFLKRNKVDFTSYYSTFEKQEQLIDYFDKKWEGAIPSTYIFDKDGNLKTKILGDRKYEEFEKEINALM